ncbi:efflux RND transporter permease subunit [Streptacidiphilus jeojiense]|uniref:Efflux RND transporter permease subunit n=1 Tax=Streptacidiphilus cavernicola TaxID=3342716 RepID=A0ABV6UGV3_9ACTN|nr:efflux RND transporter permease subunit [Streptacidiphilus jeojiense]
MRWIVSSSIRLAAAVVAAAIVVLVVGVGSLRHAAVDTLPEFLPPQVQVQTEALGLSTNEVEQLITVPLEDEFNGLAYLDRLRSQSVPGLSSIELTFKPGTDIYKARQLVTERVAQGPAVVNVGTPPVMIQPQSAQSRTMMIGLSSKSTSLIDLSTLARWRIRPRLLAVPGVANVTIWGQRDQQLQVLVDPAKLHAAGVTLSQVINTTGDAMWTSPLTFVEASSPGADGFIDTPNQRLSVQHILPITRPQDLAQVPVEDTTGKTPVKLGDVTTVVEDHPALRGDAVLSSGSGFLLVVEKLPGANTLAVTKGVEQAMAELKPGLTGVTIDTSVFRPANFVESALHDLGWSALAGLVLLTLWLGVCWRSWRVALVGLVAVALPLVAAAYVLYLLGATFNEMTLLGMLAALGIIVDDAVSGVLALRGAVRGFAARADGDRTAAAAAAGVNGAAGSPGAGTPDPLAPAGATALPHGGDLPSAADLPSTNGQGAPPTPDLGTPDPGTPDPDPGPHPDPGPPLSELLTEALVDARRPLGFALAVLLVTAVPLLLIPGLGGSMARPMVAAYVLALLAASAVALTVTPALAQLLLRPGRRRRTEPAPGPEQTLQPSPRAHWIERGYHRLLDNGLRPVVACSLAVVLALAALAIIPQLAHTSQGLLPQAQDRDLLVQWQATPGTSLPAMEKTTTAAGDSLRAVPGVQDVASDIGQSLMGDQIVNVDSAQTWVTLAPGADYGRTTAAVRKALDQQSVHHTVLTYPQLALQDATAEVTDGDDAVRVRLYGTDTKVMAVQAERLRQAVAAQPGITDPTIRQVPTEPSIEIATDVTKAAKYGLKPGDVRRATAVLVAGIPVGSYYQQQQIFDVAVWSTPAVRDNLSDLQNLMLDTPSGGLVALKDIATVSIQPAPTEIDHDQASRYVDVVATVHGQDLGTTLSRVRSAVQAVELPLGYHAEVSSGLEGTQSGQLTLVLCVLACVAGALLLFQAALRSWSRAAVLLLVLPLALSGGVLTALVNGSRITTGALVGFLPLLGIAVHGGLTLFHAFRDDADVRRAAGRTAPAVLTTAVALALLVAPFVVRGDIPGMELARPFALVVLGGLVSTTLVTLVLLPALQLWLPGGDRAPDELAAADPGPGNPGTGHPVSGDPAAAGEVR